MRREKSGQSSEHGKQLIEQLALAIADLEETEAEEETKSEIAAPEKQKAKRERTGIKPARRPLPDNLPASALSIQHFVLAANVAAPACASSVRL